MSSAGKLCLLRTRNTYWPSARRMQRIHLTRGTTRHMLLYGTRQPVPCRVHACIIRKCPSQQSTPATCESLPFRTPAASQEASKALSYITLRTAEQLRFARQAPLLRYCDTPEAAATPDRLLLQHVRELHGLHRELHGLHRATTAEIRSRRRRASMAALEARGHGRTSCLRSPLKT